MVGTSAAKATNKSAVPIAIPSIIDRPDPVGAPKLKERNASDHEAIAERLSRLDSALDASTSPGYYGAVGGRSYTGGCRHRHKGRLFIHMYASRLSEVLYRLARRQTLSVEVENHLF